MSKLNIAAEKHLEGMSIPGARRELIKDFLVGAMEANLELSDRLGDGGWGAIELWYSGRALARIFPKGGKVQIYNELADVHSCNYGGLRELNELGQWVFPVRLGRT